MAAAHHETESADTLEDSTPVPTSSPAAVSSQGIEALKDVTFGSIGGILGKFIEYPFDTVKVRLQSQSTSHNTFHTLAPLRGPFDAFAAAFRAPEGPVRSLYRGISAPLVGAAIETSSLFFSYRVAQDLLVTASPTLGARRSEHGKVELPFTALLACGAFSGAFTSVLLTPIELIKCKMQVPIPPSTLATSLGYERRQGPGAFQLIQTIFRRQGLFGFWHGQVGTLIRETGGSAAWFGSYEGVKIGFLRYDKRVQTMDDITLAQQLVAGAIAGMAYNFVFYPADTIKSRMQTEETKGAGAPRTTFWKTGTELWRQQGLKGFYRGCGITVFRAAPSSAIIFSIYEGLRRHFG